MMTMGGQTFVYGIFEALSDDGSAFALLLCVSALGGVWQGGGLKTEIGIYIYIHLYIHMRLYKF